MLVPDCRGLDQNFHDVTVVDMGDLPESHIPQGAGGGPTHQARNVFSALDSDTPGVQYKSRLSSQAKRIWFLANAFAPVLRNISNFSELA